MSPVSFYDIFPETPDLTVVDIGASELEGEPAPYKHLLESGRATVFAFEPDNGARASLSQQNRKGLITLPHFIGDGEPATFYQTNNVYTGSLFAPNTDLLSKFLNLAEMTELVSTSLVQTARLDDLAEIANFDYLKMDIQGAELSALRGASEKLKHCLVIHTEVAFVEMYKGQPLFADIDAHLRSCGFHFHCLPGIGSRTYNPPTVSGKNTQWLWADALYVRDLGSLEAVSRPTLLKMAALLNDVALAPDYSVALLNELDRRDGRGRVATFVQRILPPQAGVAS